MNIKILNTEVQDFITENLNKDIGAIAFQNNPFPEIDFREVLEQIESKKKAAQKLPAWFNTPNIYYPKKINIEQTSSEITAAYKAELTHGKTLADLTGGFGVDSYYFSKKADRVDYYEINQELEGIASHNFKQLKADAITTYAEDGLDAISAKKYNTIYLDPSRRNDRKGKVFLLEDCLPNVIEYKDYLLSRCEQLIIKTSPILDIHAAKASLKTVNEIHIVAVNNEVKELLFVLENTKKALKTFAVDITGSKTVSFSFEEDTSSFSVTYSAPKKYLYEPNAALMKSGAFHKIAEEYNLDKLHKHTHLYTSNNCIEFPGRVFKVEKIVAYKKKEIKENLAINTANITTRNFPESVETLRKKWKIKDGGDNYLFFTTNCDDSKTVILCHKI